MKITTRFVLKKIMSSDEIRKENKQKKKRCWPTSTFQNCDLNYWIKSTVNG